ncbi:MAG TPA: acyl-CoA dehydrogenase family protein [Steroidobacteraceae bacterium]|nr:acyl-CoA dehydrogenase family protein [Steroidobacteraceae bacterium]
MSQAQETFSDEHRQFRDTVRRFFQREIEPNIRQWERDGIFPRDLFRRAGAAGILQAGIPTEYGGGGGDFLHHVILHEEHGYSVAGASMGGGLGIDGSGYVIYSGGTEEQKREWLPRYASGEVIAEACFTEPQSGSDVAGFRTYARKDGSDYVINGHKIWITNGTLCTMLLVVCKTDPQGGANGMSLFLVDADTKGVSKSRPIETLHKGCANEAEFFFEDVRVPAQRLLGGREGGGFKQVMSVLNDMRIAEGARYLAAAERAFDLTLEYVKDRKAFGQRIFDFQNTQFRLAEMKTELTVGRAFLEGLLGKIKNNSLTAVDSSMAKLWLSELEFRVADQCLQFFGGMGYAHETPISQIWTHARAHRILLGTSEIHRLAIGRSL